MLGEKPLAITINIHTRSGLKGWLKRFPLIGFFGLSYFISWTIWLTQPWLNHLDPVSGKLYGILATYGPGLSAVIMSGLLRPERVAFIPWRSRIAVPILVLAASAWVTSDSFTQIASNRLPLLLATLWLLVTLLPAWMFWMIGSNRLGVRQLLCTLTTWRVNTVWWLLALGLVGLSYLLGYVILVLFGQPFPAFPRTEPFPEILRLIVFVFLGTLLYGGPLGEEIGWRGFALPRLQQRFDPLRSSLILGTVWGVWHFPLHLQGFYDGLAVFSPNLILALALRVGSGIALAIVLTWLYNRTKGNLLMMVVMHTAANLCTGWLLPINAGVYIGTVLLAVGLAVIDRMWQKPQPKPLRPQRSST